MSEIKRPVIGLSVSLSPSCDLRVGRNYLNAIWDAGGLPIPLAVTSDRSKLEEYRDMCDGFLFTGGVDVDPAQYGEVKMFDSVEVDENRDAFELAFARLVSKSGKPILGICRGIQLLNVAMGGSLYQHIDNHKQTEHGDVATQGEKIVKDSLLYTIIGKEETYVNSFHHEAVKDPAPCFVPCGFAPDGICESVYAPDHPFFLGVQWHPEMMYKVNEDADKIFKAFIKAVKNN